MRIFIFVTLLLISSVGISQQNEIVTNQTIIQLHKAGLGKDVIKSKIQSSICNFDLSADGLIILKKAGVSDDVISTMLTREGTPKSNQNDQHIPKSVEPAVIELSPGLYYFDSSQNSYSEFDPSLLTNLKSGGLGETLKRSISGLFNAKQRASLSGKEASLKFHTGYPLFLFVFDTTTRGFNNSSIFGGNVQSPNEFFLVKLAQGKNNREIVVGKINNVKSDIGIDDDIKIPFTIKKLKKGVYQVTPASPLKSGEYCFMFAASSMYEGQTHKVYDFSVN